jgi:hypothetical protein
MVEAGGRRRERAKMRGLTLEESDPSSSAPLTLKSACSLSLNPPPRTYVLDLCPPSVSQLNTHASFKRAHEAQKFKERAAGVVAPPLLLLLERLAPPRIPLLQSDPSSARPSAI